MEGPSAGTERERRVRKGKELPFDSTGNHWQSLAGADVVCPPLHQIMSLWLDPVLAGPSICSETQSLWFPCFCLKYLLALQVTPQKSPSKIPSESILTTLALST